MDTQSTLNHLKKQKLAVISTVNPNNLIPESALIAFAEDERLCLYFQTGQHTRKAQNLQKNARVALVIGLNENDLITMQYEGNAAQIVNPIEIEACKQRFITKNSPTTEWYLNHPTAIFFKVTPTWIGYSDYSGTRPMVSELNNFELKEETAVIV